MTDPLPTIRAGAWLFEEADRVGNAVIETLVTGLAPAEQARLAALTALHRRREFVLGRALARTALWACLDQPTYLDGEVSHRPYAVRTDGTRHAGVNISHSRDVVVCVATAAELRIGCDVERLRPRSAAGWQRLAREELAHPVFSLAERGALVALDSALRDRVFLAAWTTKEAIGKARGSGIYRGDLAERAIDIAALARWCGSGEQALALQVSDDWQIELRRLPDAWFAVALRGAALELSVHAVTLAQLQQGMVRTA